ncbi:MAG: prepilin-type N-terminal cleavage/methylation domain-containing protein [Armatimonadetes bacterium]|nr:prepilin-type N-terminal cleavage/methylation domain-containing protein [Armatimonadota bacterium]MBS1710092.1 prepilin-type N-terminal cleavage/methylation domain-containing protein [Armatimonadota bacterium]MBX3109982.1 prepilin-type N-terminal cleavage/methylation domain-containing protein [Fimbriimonadaceae bacterium]
MKFRAFTLIELLVVIAIIAILAAILFPVFAQAKAAAKKTQALSNMKQIATSSHIYASDYDDRFPSLYDGPNCGGDPICTMYPYIKNLQMWSGHRQNGRPNNITYNATTGAFTTDRNDIGYNWGWEIRGAEGMLDEEKCANGGPVQGCVAGPLGRRYNTGKSNTQFVNPADMFAFGNTYDTPRQTMGGIDWFFDDYPGGTKNSGIYFGGKITVAFADSHAKVIAWKGGQATLPGSGTVLIGSPKSFDQRAKGYCADPDATIHPYPRDGFPLGFVVCKDFVALPEAVGVTWWND